MGKMSFNYSNKTSKMKHWILVVFAFLSLLQCTKKPQEEWVPTAYVLDVPEHFEQNLIAPVIPSKNPLTAEGIALGKRLFFDRKLSGDGTIACAHCHKVQNAFSDNRPVSSGVRNISGTRNAMPLFNLAWNYDDQFAWDGKELGLEEQAREPITNPDEMDSTWEIIIPRLEQDPVYLQSFEAAFGAAEVTSDRVVQALAQFERTLISGNAKFDRYQQGQATLTPLELEGLAVFMDETRGDCFHCHGNPNNPLWTDNQFHNNGLDAEFTDLGRGAVTGNPQDNGKFRTPSLRNLSFTAPYMHDGRFQTIDQVIEHYSSGLQPSTTLDPLMKKVAQGGVQLTAEDKAALKAFLLTLNDPSFLAKHTNNP
jgi:cytochrome c peroxidase